VANIEPKLDFLLNKGAASPVFSSDASSGVDHLGDSVDAAILAELVAHKGTQAPLTLGLFGGPGSGKSTFLNLLLDRVAAVAGATRGEAGAFLARIVTVRVTAATGAEPETQVARALYQALASDSTDYSALIDEAQYAGRDPQTSARAAQESLGAARIQLDGERQALHELNGRSVRLSETVLFETAGSRVDAYARKVRSTIEPRLRAFGFETGDPVTTFKTTVRDVAESGGMFPRLGGFFRSLWAFKGQSKLLIWAVISLILGWATGIAEHSQDVWGAVMKSWPDSLQPTVSVILAHNDWLRPMQAGLYGLALVLVGWNIWRAIKFFMPISHGVALLRNDIVVRKRDLDGLIAHQTQRVGVLSEEVDRAARRSDEAAHRARGDNSSRVVMVPDFVARDAAPAVAFIRAVNDFVTGKLALVRRNGDKATANLPQRLVIGVDGLDGLSSPEAKRFLQFIGESLNGAAFVTIVAASGAEGLSRTEWAKLVQVPYALGARQPLRENGRLIAAMIAPSMDAETIAIDPKSSILDRPLEPNELGLLNKMSDLAGNQPRDVKRYVNIYRLVRSLEDDNAPALALALALQSGATLEEAQKFDAALAQTDVPDLPEFEGRLGYYVLAARKANGDTLTVAQMRRARALAKRFTFA